MKFGNLIVKNDIMSLLKIESETLNFGVDTEVWWIQTNKKESTGLLDHIFSIPAHLVVKKYVL